MSVKKKKITLFQRTPFHSRLTEKWKESLHSILPISLIVLLLCFTVVPMPADLMCTFMIGCFLLVVGMGVFNVGTELAMTPIGEKVGGQLTRSRSIRLVLIAGFLAGFFVTVAEPDLTVLANQVSNVPNLLLILSVGAGVGLLLMLSLYRIFKRIDLRLLLFALYALVFILAIFEPRNFLSVAFDSGGVTTGPMTVPFIMGLGVGVASIRSDSGAENDSFGLVALCSVGPILAVMLLGIIFRPDSGNEMAISIARAEDSLLLRGIFAAGIPEYMRDMALSLLPIIVFYSVFHYLDHTGKAPQRTIVMGLIYTYIGLVLFMTGANVGLLPIGYYLGLNLSETSKWLLIPVGMIMGWYTVSAEPAVQVLCDQVYEMTAGAVPKKALMLSMSAGVSVAVGLAILRSLTGLSILWLIVPGYALALVMMLFTPRVFTAIAFDSGGVASGPMTAAFLLPLSIGACKGVGGSIAQDAFGVVTMVAMTPLITIQALGLIYQHKQRRSAAKDLADQAEEIIEM